LSHIENNTEFGAGGPTGWNWAPKSPLLHAVPVGGSRLVEAGGSADPCLRDETLPNCSGEHDGLVVVEGPSAINTAAPLVCDVQTGECLACESAFPGRAL
jgi:hypothetical protein